MNPVWYYDESRFVNVNFHDVDVVEQFNLRHQKFRDFKKEAEEIMSDLKVSGEDSVIDFGCGTGSFVLNAAPSLRRVYAVDVSKIMLEYCRKKADGLGLQNISFHQDGFLSYKHNGDPVDGAVSSLALHHLPDFWKYTALLNIKNILKKSGRFYLLDIVFNFDGNMIDEINKWISDMKNKIGDGVQMEDHVRMEYSTYDWILEKILDKAGFKIEKKEVKEFFATKYVCVNE